METWKWYALASAVFAGLTSVVAKLGLQSLSADTANLIRTAFVLVFVLINSWLWTGMGKAVHDLQRAGWTTTAWLALSALTTALSWICYYRAMKDGTVSYVSLIDKSSILLTLVLSVLWLGEPLTWRMAGGAALVLSGLWVLAGK